jgi:hypothetical protein
MKKKGYLNERHEEKDREQESYENRFPSKRGSSENLYSGADKRDKKIPCVQYKEGYRYV